ncbi:Hypothetical protein Bdt_1749 [Bdellovibrio bacteriovorus str. Tiberius]|uniref:Uncharacterized protein n=1 Tax=Bdellovibrio bacteriovorus str. Tiberius TaxID=1069642 RepID=K7ZA29_BDEBC|nr:Hypothetical protein Bdt_1749 [Bdellovibrio bacteriovorus str. Tiberius]
MLAFIPFMTNKTTRNAVTLIVIPTMDNQAIRFTKEPARGENIK